MFTKSRHFTCVQNLCLGKEEQRKETQVWRICGSRHMKWVKSRHELCPKHSHPGHSLPITLPWVGGGVHGIYPSFTEVTEFQMSSLSSPTCSQSYLLERGLEPDQPALVPSSCWTLDLDEFIHLLGNFDVGNLQNKDGLENLNPTLCQTSRCLI